MWVLAILPLVGFWTYGLFDLDEGIYAASLREMLERHTWITITYGGAPFYEKPILIYWAARMFHGVGLPSELALRLPSVLAAIGTYWMLFAFVRKRFGVEKASNAVLVLALSPLMVVMARMFTPDSLLLFFSTGAFLAFWESIKGGPKWRWLSALFLGFAVLAKGPFPLVIFAVLLLFVLVTMPERRSGLKGGWIVGTLIFMGVLSTWYVPVYLVEGQQFFREFILFQNLGRLQGGDTAHLGPFYYYFPIVIAMLLPFIFAIGVAWKKGRGTDLERYLWVWAVSVFLLFSIAGSKLPHYILPALSPIAILLGIHLGDLPEKSRWFPRVYGLLIGAGMIGASLTVEGLPVNLLPIGIIIFIVSTLVIFSDGIEKWRHPRFANSAIVVGAAMVSSVAIIGVPNYWEGSHGDIGQVARMLRDTNMPVFEYRNDGMGEKLTTSHPSLQWYLGHSTLSGNFLDQLYSKISTETIILSRKSRLGGWQLKALSKAGVTLSLTNVVGEYQIYRASR